MDNEWAVYIRFSQWVAKEDLFAMLKFAMQEAEPGALIVPNWVEKIEGSIGAVNIKARRHRA
jgi:hypothetical protein